MLTITAVFLVLMLSGLAAWPWWWSVVLGMAWAPLLWLPEASEGGSGKSAQLLFGCVTVIGLTTVALSAHALPLGLQDMPDDSLGLIALAGMAALYLCQVLLQSSHNTCRACVNGAMRVFTLTKPSHVWRCAYGQLTSHPGFPYTLNLKCQPRLLLTG